MVNPVLKRALDTWGEEAQMLMVVEEMSELMKEILKNVNRGKDNVDQIVEETADVEIMLEQLNQMDMAEMNSNMQLVSQLILFSPAVRHPVIRSRKRRVKIQTDILLLM